MPRMTRYVLFELTKVFVLVLTALTAFMIIFGVASEGIRQGLGLKPLVQLIPYVVPDALRFAVPATMLFAVCSVFGRMSADNEIKVLKSMGISPLVVVWPVLVFAFFVSLAAVWLNDIAVSWGRQGIHQVVLQSVEQIAYGMLRTHKSYSTNRLAISVVNVDGRTLVQPTLTMHSSESAPAVTMTAERARLRLNQDRDALTLVLENSEVDWGDRLGGVFPGMIEHEIPLAFASKKGELGDGPSECPLRYISRNLEQQQQSIMRLEQAMAGDAAFAMLTGDFAALHDEVWRRRELAVQDHRRLVYRYETEPWRRWANGFSCLFFAMVGTPLAIRMRTADFWVTFLACFLPILVVYYPFFAIGVDQAKIGAAPPYTVWLGNLVLMFVGVWMLRKVRRY